MAQNPSKDPWYKAPDMRSVELLLATANNGERFNLLDDPLIPKPNIGNPIHPIFDISNFTVMVPQNEDIIHPIDPQDYRRLRRAFQLASLFLGTDSILQWYVQPLMGRTCEDRDSRRLYLLNPLDRASEHGRADLVDEVRKALNCLSDHVTWIFHAPSTPLSCYAITQYDHSQKFRRKSSCWPRFKSRRPIRIRLREGFLEFVQQYHQTSNICDKLRFEFIFASTIVHEVTHALGAMRRGLMSEPFLDLTHEEPEWGWAWEKFMFGGILNPLVKDQTTVSYLTRKRWGDKKRQQAAGGRDFHAIPMSYIAQWFQKSTWKAIEAHGPTAVIPPDVHLKLVQTTSFYYIESDNKASLEDIQALKYEFQKNTHPRASRAVTSVLATKCRLRRTSSVQRWTVPSPTVGAGVESTTVVRRKVSISNGKATVGKVTVATLPSSTSPAERRRRSVSISHGSYTIATPRVEKSRSPKRKTKSPGAIVKGYLSSVARSPSVESAGPRVEHKDSRWNSFISDEDYDD